jgi:hypothetical protein
LEISKLWVDFCNVEGPFCKVARIFGFRELFPIGKSNRSGLQSSRPGDPWRLADRVHTPLVGSNPSDGLNNSSRRGQLGGRLAGAGV